MDDAVWSTRMSTPWPGGSAEIVVVVVEVVVDDAEAAPIVRDGPWPPVQASSAAPAARVPMAPSKARREGVTKAPPREPPNGSPEEPPKGPRNGSREGVVLGRQPAAGPLGDGHDVGERQREEAAEQGGVLAFDGHGPRYERDRRDGDEATEERLLGGGQPRLQRVEVRKGVAFGCERGRRRQRGGELGGRGAYGAPTGDGRERLGVGAVVRYERGRRREGGGAADGGGRLRVQGDGGQLHGLEEADRGRVGHRRRRRRGGQGYSGRSPANRSSSGRD